MSAIGGLDHKENKHTLYCGKDCTKNFCASSLREQAKSIIGFEKKRILPLTKEELESHQDAKVCCICGKRILKTFSKTINFRKVRDHCHYTGEYRGAAHNTCNSKFKVPNEIPSVFHNSSN